MEQNYKISTSQKKGIVELAAEGEITTETANALMQEIYGLVESMNPDKLILDIRLLKGRFGYTDAYFQVKEYPSFLYKIKVAIVDMPEYTDYHSFHEYVAVSSGFDFKWFADIETARKWLKNRPPQKEMICP